MTEVDDSARGRGSELDRLRRELRRSERRLDQALRDAATAEAMSTQSKRAMLRTHEELNATIGRLEATARELAEAKARAEQASEAKGRFLATMSHEIRTPMNGVLGAVELLLTTQLDSEQEQLAKLMHQSGNALMALINDILDFSKIEAGRVALEEVPFDLAACIRGAFDLQRAAATDKDLELRLHLAADLPATVVGDPTRVRQVLLNLLGNAVKFTAVGHVELRAQRVSGSIDAIRFDVEDTGIGIKPQALQAVFEAFTQEDETTTRRFGGTGLGLAICRHLAQAMQGKVSAVSEPGRGSTFSFECRLPEAVVTTPVAAEPVALRERRFSGRRILVVDDVAANRLIATKMLERLGCTVTCAGDGAEALRLLDAGSFDLVFLDCAMPVMDGFETVRRVRQRDNATARIPVVAMTAYSMAGDEHRCLEAGMDAYLSKPLMGQAVGEALARFFGEPAATT